MTQSNPARFTIVDASVVANEVQISWDDGHQSNFHPLWLRHQCECEFCGTSLTAVRGLRLLDIPDDIAPEVDTYRHDRVSLRWSNDGHCSEYQAHWLRDHCYSDSERKLRKHRPTLWDASTMAMMPCADFREAAQDPSARLAMLETVAEYGFCKIVHAPVELEQVNRLIELVGQQRQTHFGSLVMKKRAKVNDVGDITAALAPHTDESYRLSTIGITIFQVLCPSPIGGDSTLVDGFEAARRLREESPEDFELLTRVPIITHRLDRAHNSNGPPRWYASRLPIIKLDYDNEICGVRLNERQIAPLDVPADLIGPCYRALRRMLTLVYDPSLRLTFKLGAGEGLVFNNQRLLHGRTEFSSEKPARSVSTTSVDLEEFYSNIRLLRASLRNDPLSMVYGQGMSG